MNDYDRWIIKQLLSPKLWAQAFLAVLISWAATVVLFASPR
jgi:hypothetical protein